MDPQMKQQHHQNEQTIENHYSTNVQSGNGLSSDGNRQKIIEGYVSVWTTGRQDIFKKQQILSQHSKRQYFVSNLQGNLTKLFMCRRAMKKLYDLEPEYLKINRQLTYQHKRYRRRIFEKLDQQIGKGDKVIHLYSLFKENGEHCQVSHVSKLGQWLFGSKNVAIQLKMKQIQRIIMRKRDLIRQS